MKTHKNTLKSLLAVLVLLAAGIAAHAQSIDKSPAAQVEVGPLTPIADPGRVERITPLLEGDNSDYETLHSVLFYNPGTQGPSLTLTASLVEDSERRLEDAALSFTHYRWYYRGADNSPATTVQYGLAPDGTLKVVATDPTSNQHPVSQLTPGFHYFRVEGLIVPPGITDLEQCEVVSEDFVVYVLPPLAVSATHEGDNPDTVDFLTYCEPEDDQTPPTGIPTFNATVNYDGYAGPPAIADGFTLRYTWYAVKSTGDNNLTDDPTQFPIIDDTKANLTGAEAQGTEVVASNTDSFTPIADEVGSYKYFVEVEYTVKDRDYDGEETPQARERVYAIFRQWVGGTNQATATIVHVTPRPGKPHITIENVID